MYPGYGQQPGMFNTGNYGYGQPPMMTNPAMGNYGYGQPGVVQQTTTTQAGMYGQPGMFNTGNYGYAQPPMMNTPMMTTPMYGQPPGVVQQTTTTMGVQPMMTAPAMVQTTTSYAPVVNSCFGRPIQLYNHHAKFLCGGSNNPHGHHNPNHGFNQSSYWFIEPHEMFGDKVRLRNQNGMYLCHIGGSMFCSMYPVASHNDVAWHMEMYPGFSGQNVLFRSHHGHYLSLDKHGSHVHCKSHWNGPHESQRFEIRYC